MKASTRVYGGALPARLLFSLESRIGALLLSAGLAIAALELGAVPAVAWLASVALTALALAAVLTVVGPPVARRTPFAGAALAAAMTAAAPLLPQLAASPFGIRVEGVLAGALFLGGILCWLELFERPLPE